MTLTYNVMMKNIAKVGIGVIIAGISVITLGVILPEKDWFAPSQFFKFSDSEKISTQPLQKFEAGVCMGTRLCLSEKVTRVVDGDTLHLGVYKIRLSLVDTPEINEEGSSEATEFTSKLCPEGSTIIVDQDDLQPTDRYDRILGKVFCGDKVLNSELLENGYAIILKQYCSTSEFADEEWAKKFGC